MAEIMDYDPNLTCSGRMAKQTVRLTFGVWEYRKTMEVEVGGNCTGLIVIEAAVGIAYEQLERRGIYASDETYAVIYMPHPVTGEVLECGEDDPEGPQGEDWLERMLIGAEIIAIRPE